MMDSVACPACDGRGGSVGIACGPSGCRNGIFVCPLCDASGQVASASAAAIYRQRRAFGQQLHAERLERWESQASAAARLHLDVRCYSRVAVGLEDLPPRAAARLDAFRGSGNMIE